MNTYSAAGTGVRTGAMSPAGTPFTLLAVAFLLPFTQLVQIQLVGRLYLQDLIAPALFLILLGGKDANRRLAEGTTFYLLIALWFLGQVVTDIDRATPPEDYLRGLSRIALLAVNFAALWLLSRGRIQVLSFYLVGTAISKILEVTFLPDEMEEGDPWKFGYAIAFLYLGAVAGNTRTAKTILGPYASAIILGLIATLSLLLNARSAFGIAAIAAIYSTFAIWVSGRPGLVSMIKPWTFGAIIALGLIFSQAMIYTYSVLAEAGYLGNEAQKKFEMQSESQGLGLLLSGRAETLVSVQAIADSPLLGHGSWAKDRYYVRLYYDERWRRGLETYGRLEGENDLIPTHSHFFGAWVEAGILGAVFWAWVLLLGFRALYGILKVNSLPSPIVVVCGMCILWDVLFSPFGAEQRFAKAAQIAVLLLASTTAEGLSRTRLQRLTNGTMRKSLSS